MRRNFCWLILGPEKFNFFRNIITENIFDSLKSIYFYEFIKKFLTFVTILVSQPETLIFEKFQIIDPVQIPRRFIDQLHPIISGHRCIGYKFFVDKFHLARTFLLIFYFGYQVISCHIVIRFLSNLKLILVFRT